MQQLIGRKAFVLMCQIRKAHECVQISVDVSLQDP